MNQDQVPEPAIPGWVPQLFPGVLPRAITLRRPWARLVVEGAKTVENRAWRTPYRGMLFIHAGLSVDTTAPEVRGQDAGPVGLVGVVRLVDICDRSWGDPAVGPDECGCGPWSRRGTAHWRLAHAVAFANPIGHPGRPGLWVVERDAVDALRAALTAAAAPAGGWGPWPGGDHGAGAGSC